MKAYHFIDGKWGLEAIRHRRLKISRFDSVNDPFEWAVPAGASAEERRAFSAMKTQMSKDRGILCLSQDWHNPLLWSHYADRHRGICLGFEIDHPAFWPIRYKRDRIICDWSLFRTDQDYALSVVQNVITTKFSHWRYERELRGHIALDHSTAEDGKYFFDFQQGFALSEVIVGALSSITRSDLRSSLGDLANSVKAKKARLAFKTFRVVEQRKASQWN